MNRPYLPDLTKVIATNTYISFVDLIDARASVVVIVSIEVEFGFEETFNTRSDLVVVQHANGRTIVEMLNFGTATVDVIMGNGQLDVTVDSRQVAFLGQRSAREGCSCNSRSKNRFFSCCVFLFELTQVFDGSKSRFLLAGTTLGSACRVSDCPCHSCGNSFSSFYKTSTLALDLNHLHSFIKALRDEPALIQCSIFCKFLMAIF